MSCKPESVNVIMENPVILEKPVILENPVIMENPVILEKPVHPGTGNEKGVAADGDVCKGDGWYKIDDVLEYFGRIGKFQITITVVQFLVAATAGARVLFDLFAAKFIPWACTAEGLLAGCSDAGPGDVGKRPCEVGLNGHIEQNITGTGAGRYWDFAAEQTSHSIVSAFNLRCEEDWKFSFISSIFFIGALLGVCMFGVLSDMIGRRKSLIVSLVMCVVQAWTIPFFDDMNVYLACRFYDGMAFGGYFLIGYILTVEYSPPKFRNIVGSTSNIFCTVGMASLPGFAYAFKVWRWYAVLQAIPPTASLVACFYVMPESPRYYLSIGKESKARELLQKVADTNGKKMPQPCTLYEDVSEKEDILNVFKHKRFMLCAFINMFGWFMTSMVYYMLWFSAKYLDGDIYINVVLLGLAEIPGRLLGIYAVDAFGRKKTFMLTMCCACLCMFVSIWDNVDCRKAMYCVGKALAATLWAAIYIYSSEMYPTKIRNLGSGIGSAAARVAALLAPFVGKLFDISAVLPYILVGALAFACCGLFWLVPETKNKDLPQNLAEFENLFKPPKNKKRDKQEI